MSNEASAVTLRGRLGFQTGKAFDTSFLAEGEYIWPLVSRYNSTLNGNTEYPTVVLLPRAVLELCFLLKSFG